MAYQIDFKYENSILETFIIMIGNQLFSSDLKIQSIYLCAVANTHRVKNIVEDDTAIFTMATLLLCRLHILDTNYEMEVEV